MVQPITVSLGRNAKLLSSGNRVITETYKVNNGGTITVTRVLNKNGDVLKTRMKKIFETILKSGKRILTREDELHVQEKIAGTEKPKNGSKFTNKLFKFSDKLFSSEDNKLLFERNVAYKKSRGADTYSDKVKTLKTDKLSSETLYKESKDVSKAKRDIKTYTGKDVVKLQHSLLTYDDSGIPKESNNFDLREFEIFNK